MQYKEGGSPLHPLLATSELHRNEASVDTTADDHRPGGGQEDYTRRVFGVWAGRGVGVATPRRWRPRQLPRSAAFLLQFVSKGHRAQPPSNHPPCFSPRVQAPLGWTLRAQRAPVCPTWTTQSTSASAGAATPTTTPTSRTTGTPPPPQAARGLGLVGRRMPRRPPPSDTWKTQTPRQTPSVRVGCQLVLLVRACGQHLAAWALAWAWAQPWPPLLGFGPLCH